MRRLTRFGRWACAVAFGMAVAGCSSGGVTGGGSDVYLTCEVDGEAIRVDGLGTVVANYQTREDETVVQTGGPQKYRFLLVIPGKRTGSWHLGDLYLSLSVTTLSDMTVSISANTYRPRGAALQVGLTGYEDVGGFVDGTFSGTAVQILTGKKMVVTNGRFHAERIPDVTR